MAAAIKLELDKVDFSQGRRLQEGESMAQPVKSVQAEAAATATCGERCGDFKITVRAFGPALQAISEEMRELDFLKSVANTLRSTEAELAYEPVITRDPEPAVMTRSPPPPRSPPAAPAAPSPPDEPSRVGGGAREQELPGEQSSDQLSGGETFLRYGLWAVLLVLLCACALTYYLVRRKRASPPQPRDDALNTTIDASSSNGADEAGGVYAASREVKVS